MRPLPSDGATENCHHLDARSGHRRGRLHRSVVTEELVRDGHEVVVYDNSRRIGKQWTSSRVVKGELLDGDTLRISLTTQPHGRHAQALQ